MYSLDEIWKSIKGFEGYYEVSNLGNIRSCDRFINDKGGYRFKKGQLMKSKYSHNGYLRIKLMKESKKYYFFVHRLVCKAFHGEKPKNGEVNHKNFKKDDNRACNLEWVTKSKNINLTYESFNHGKSNIILNLSTGIYYPSIKSASIAHDIHHRALHSMLIGRYKNKTSLIKV